MKGFIEIVMLNGDKSIESLRNIDRVYRYGDANNVKANQEKAVIVLNRLPHNHLISAETYDEIAEKIEEATEQPEPRQNIYYRTSDRLPTAEDADAKGRVLATCSECDNWRQVLMQYVDQYKFWAPCPKVEVRG